MAHEALIETGRYRARIATTEADLGRAQALRAQVFRRGTVARDTDAFDNRCRHVLIEDCADGALLGAFRLLTLRDGRDLPTSYAAQFYDLAPLAGVSAPMVEVGRFCLATGAGDADVMRVVWAAFARLVDAEGIGMFFGCSSFAGPDPALHRDPLALLAVRHLGPATLRPGEKAAEVVRYADHGSAGADLKRGQKLMPPLLRAYLAMGGWVSDHAVIDRDLGTVHVFTALDVAAIPPARARILRGIVADSAPAMAGPVSPR